MENQKVLGLMLEELKGIGRRLGAVEKGRAEMCGDIVKIRRGMRAERHEPA